MRVIDAETADRLLDFPGLINALEQAHKAPPPKVDKSLLLRDRSPAAPESFLVWPAWAPGDYFGVKMATSMPDNKALPTVHSVYQLFDGGNGTPLATIDAGPLTLRKTAADSALGSRLLAREDAEHMLMVGAGGQAPYMIAGHLAARPSIRKVMIWNRSREKAEQLLRALADQFPDVKFALANDLESAVRQADLISCATGATSPLVRGEWLQPGCHLDLVGGYTPDMREADDEAVRRAKVFVDSRWFAISDVGDIQGAIDAGVITAEDVAGDLFDVCSGKVAGRTTPEDITLFKNGGGGHLDLFTAVYLWQQVKA